jgi:hypothetical protein
MTKILAALAALAILATAIRPRQANAQRRAITTAISGPVTRPVTKSTTSPGGDPSPGYFHSRFLSFRTEPAYMAIHAKPMTSDDYQAALDGLGLSAARRWPPVRGRCRTTRRWALGESPRSHGGGHDPPVDAKEAPQAGNPDPGDKAETREFDATQIWRFAAERRLE